MNRLVSVIIPVYNTEKYLNCCLDSVTGQTYKTLEILLIDDGSTDSSGRICDAYAASDQRIRVVHQENAGLSDARNKGIDLAEGDYLAFVDSDDYIREDYIEILLAACVKEDCDAAIADYKRVAAGDCCREAAETAPTECISNIQASLRIYDYAYYIRTITAWGKLFRKNLFQNIRFPSGKIHEDEAVTYQLLYYAHRVAYIDAVLYYYRQNGEGIILSGFSQKSFYYLEALEERLEFYRQRHECQLYDLTLNRLYFDLVNYYNKTRQYIKNPGNLKRSLRKKQLRLYPALLGKKAFSLRRKLRYTWALFLPVQYYRHEVTGKAAPRPKADQPLS